MSGSAEVSAPADGEKMARSRAIGKPGALSRLDGDGATAEWLEMLQTQEAMELALWAKAESWRR
jgi:hypothetical protein